jgi:hypothetical protein
LRQCSRLTERGWVEDWPQPGIFKSGHRRRASPPHELPAVELCMKRRVYFALGAWLLLAGAARAQVVFDGSLGTLPAEQGWSFASFPAQASQSHTGDAARLTTTATTALSAGYARTWSAPLSRETGFNLALRLRVADETHNRPDRAGFSVIVLAADLRGIELGFWTNLVFAQADQPLFTHAEDAVHDFRGAFTDLVLSVRGDHYRLLAGGAPLLAGPVRAYTGFTGFPDVYETPNFLFLGDDTTSAAGAVEIARVALVLPPALRLGADGRLRWAGVPGQTYGVERSADLRIWERSAQVTSATGDFEWETAPVGDGGFWRVVHP